MFGRDLFGAGIADISDFLGVFLVNIDISKVFYRQNSSPPRSTGLLGTSLFHLPIAGQGSIY